MKKIISIFALITLMLSFAACGSVEDEITSAVDDATTAAEAISSAFETAE